MRIIRLEKYNFLYLLNISDTIIKYSPLINLWNGSNRGEGYLMYAKLRMSNIHSTNWQINAHMTLLNENSINDVIQMHMLHKASDYHKTEYMKYMNTSHKNGKE